MYLMAEHASPRSVIPGTWRDINNSVLQPHIATVIADSF